MLQVITSSGGSYVISLMKKYVFGKVNVIEYWCYCCMLGYTYFYCMGQ